MSREQKPADVTPKPFLRWAGGKRRLTALLVDSIPESFDPRRGNYFEPFVGGGALLFALGAKYSEFYIPGNRVHINDSNPDLVTTYKVLKKDVNGLVKRLSIYSKNISKTDYERMRKYEPTDPIAQAARFIYLNKTCFNGLWRVNSKGEFNVPWGKLKNPLIFDEQNLLACSERLRGVTITSNDFSAAVKKCKSGDLVYFDPPYLPLSSSSNFSKYAKADFTEKEHEKLAKTIQELTARQVFVVLSNSDTPLSRDIFGPILNLRQITMNRSISASSSSRKPVSELLAVNFKLSNNSELKGFKSLNRNRGILN